MERLGYARPFLRLPARRIDAAGARDVEEAVAEETPVTLAYNGVSHAVMMATPDDFEDFAVGFSLTEGLVESEDEISTVGVVRYSRGIELQIETTGELVRVAGRRRLSGRTGCGLCGKDDVEDVLRALPSVASDVRFGAAAVSRAMLQLSERQPLNAATGAVHAAAWADGDGTVSVVREDVGRHNALDKLVGALARAGIDAGGGFVAMTSRGSFELVQKAAILGVPLLTTVSAPTGLAIRVAQDVGMTLAGFARDGRVTVYSHHSRIHQACS